MLLSALPTELPELTRRAGFEPATEVTVAKHHRPGWVKQTTTAIPAPGNKRKEFGTSARSSLVNRGNAPAPSRKYSGRYAHLRVTCGEVTLFCRHRRDLVIVSELQIRFSRTPRITHRAANKRHNSGNSDTLTRGNKRSQEREHLGPLSWLNDEPGFYTTRVKPELCAAFA